MMAIISDIYDNILENKDSIEGKQQYQLDY